MNLLTANPPINLYRNDSHCAIAQRPLATTFSAYSYKTNNFTLNSLMNLALTSTVPSGKLKRF